MNHLINHIPADLRIPTALAATALVIMALIAWMLSRPDKHPPRHAAAGEREPVGADYWPASPDDEPEQHIGDIHDDDDHCPGAVTEPPYWYPTRYDECLLRAHEAFPRYFVTTPAALGAGGRPSLYLVGRGDNSTPAGRDAGGDR